MNFRGAHPVSNAGCDGLALLKSVPLQFVLLSPQILNTSLFRFLVYLGLLLLQAQRESVVLFVIVAFQQPSMTLLRTEYKLGMRTREHVY